MVGRCSALRFRETVPVARLDLCELTIVGLSIEEVDSKEGIECIDCAQVLFVPRSDRSSHLVCLTGFRFGLFL